MQFFNHPEGYVEPDGSGGYDYIYQYKDHLGNIRLAYGDDNGDGIITTSTEIREINNYYPFGLEHKGYNSVVNGVENKYMNYNGKELEEDLNLGWIDYGARRYMRDIGRWTSIDPMADKMRNNSPFNYAFNNPILFVDPDGEFPIIIHVRSFAPFKHFGAGLWHGDNRSFSRNPYASSRLHQITNFETDTGAFTTQAFGSISSSRYGAWAYSEAHLRNEGSTPYNLRTHMFGNNDAVFPAWPGTMVPPDGGPTWAIDVHTNLNVEVSDLDGGDQLLSICGQVSGDTFPNAEAFVSDAEGNSVWLGTFATQSGPNTGPFFTLAGDSNDPMININIGIVTNKDGIFKGVRVGDKTISLEQWNKDTTGPMSVDEFKKNHKDLYDQLFGSTND
ncbi:RHS repeat protein [Poritiphilus flavus]|uniref:RHS repeat-associated core domain-containing protein n=1 Tax=Poritiphilus flavus TaxID=2697053 RepID=A0A6L9EDH4_9FLAO|nr:RHS repeat-associated core domain-containing protein [Poritiphilus flavus]NAS12671.1 hypothetical protein [Poritiphilus flavus]